MMAASLFPLSSMKKSSDKRGAKVAALLIIAAAVMIAAAILSAECCKHEPYVIIDPISFDVPITDKGTPEIAVYTAESE